MNGLMLDLSRGQIPKLYILKDMIDVAYNNNIDFISVYLEHTFPYSKHPIIWKKSGALSRKEFSKLEQYAHKKNIELIPSIQTLGHFEKILRHKEYSHLSETERFFALSPSVKETYTLLEDLISDVASFFSSPYINIGLDEVWDLAEGKSRGLSKKLGGKEFLFLHHLMKIKKIVDKFNKKIIIWGDMLLHHPSIIKKLPNDIYIGNWWYEDDTVVAFEKRIRTLGNQHKQWIVHGTSTWTTIFPEITRAKTNISHFTKASQKYVKNRAGFLLTTWGDDGNFNFLGEAIPGLLYYIFLLRKNKSINTLYQNFFAIKTIPFDMQKYFEFLGDVYKKIGFSTRYELFFAFWDEPFLIHYFANKSLSVKPLIRKITKMYVELNNLSPRKHKDFYKEILFKIQVLLSFLKRIDFLQNVRTMYFDMHKHKHNEKIVNEKMQIILSYIKQLQKETKEHLKNYKKLWKKNYRGEACKINTRRFLFLLQQYKRLYKKLKKIKRQYRKKGGDIPLNMNFKTGTIYWEQFFSFDRE